MPDPKIVVSAVGDFRSLYGDLSKTESKFGRLSGAVRAGLIGATVAGGAALIGLGKEAVDAASLSQQSIGATESVFGKFADTVVRRSNEAAEAVGLSANEYRELANVTGAMLAAAGTPLKRVTTLTDQLNRRAADMAATFGGTTREAVEAISSLLRGETDPIERYGVAIKQSDVSARLAAEGLDKLTGNALKQAEQQVRLELLFDQTSKTQGQFARESDTLAGAQQRLGAKVEDLEAKFGTLLLPALTEVATWAGDELVPALEDLAGWLSDNRDEIADTGATIKDALLPPLQSGVDLVKTAVGVWSDLPGPVKEVGIEAGVAALVLPRLTGAIQSGTGVLGGFVTKVRDAETRTAALASAARTAAGIGGMVALTQSAGETNDTLRLVERTAGLAALGFSVAGPWGAAAGAVGGLASALGPLRDKMDGAREAMQANREEARRYKNTLDDVTGAVTEQTRAQALQAVGGADADATARQLGLTSRQLVNAYLGQEGALRRVKNALANAGVQFDETGNVIDQFDESGRLLNPVMSSLGHLILDGAKRTERFGAQIRRATKSSRDYGDTLKHVPRKVETFIENHGILPSVRGIARVVRQARELAPDLKRRDIKAIIEASGVDTTVRAVRRAEKALQDVGRQRPKPPVGADDREFVTKNRRILADLRELDRQQVNPKTSLSLDEYFRRRAELISSLRNIPDEYVNIWVTRRDGGGGGGGGGGGLGPTRSVPLETVDRTVGSGPDLSRIATERGQQIGEAVGRGLAKTKSGLQRAGQDAIAQILLGVVAGSSGIGSALDKLNDLIDRSLEREHADRVAAIKRRLDGKAEARALKALNAQWKHHVKDVRDGLADEYAALKRNGRAQDEINRKLEKARAHLAEVRGFVNQIRQSFIDTANITSLGVLDDGSVSGELLLDQLRDQVADADRFAELIRQLSDNEGPRLNQTTLQQLLAAGPEAGLATAEALLHGGAAAIREINDLTAHLAATGQQLGSQMSNQFFDVGLQAAQGLVDGLSAQSRALDRAARRLARKLAAEVRKALGIQSPSREFKDIGTQVIRGLTIGLDDTYVRKAGRKTAEALVDGFSRPQLDAGVLAGSGSAAPQVVTVRLRADQVDRVQRGKDVLMDITLAQQAGARVFNVGGVRNG